MADPLVSIIIPVFNAEKYLAESLYSAINQTWPNKEIIVVDDGSADNSLQIAKSFASSNLHIISQQKKGASAARNTGLKHAKGEYIQFLDADDILSLNKIEAQVRLLSTKPGYISLCATVHFWNGSDHQSALPQWDFTLADAADPVDFLINLYGGNPDYPTGGMVQPNAWLTQKQIIDQAGLWNEELSVDDDGEFFCRALLASCGVIFADGTFNYYRKYQHKQNLSAVATLKGFESMLLAIDLKKQHLSAKYNPVLTKRIFAKHYWNVALLSYPRFKKTSVKAVSKADNYKGKKYAGSSTAQLISRFVGWRLLRYINYFRYGF